MGHRCIVRNEPVWLGRHFGRAVLGFVCESLKPHRELPEFRFLIQWQRCFGGS
jgi:hypothetical protein